MTRCAVCNHRLVHDADSMFLAGASASAVARLLGVSPDSAKRHRHAGHVVPASVVASPVAPVAPSTKPTAPTDLSAIDATTAEAQLDVLKGELDKMLAGATSQTARVAIIQEQRRLIEARYRVVGPAPSATIRVQDIEGFQEYESLLFSTLDPYPDARRALAKVLRERLAQRGEA